MNRRTNQFCQKDLLWKLKLDRAHLEYKPERLSWTDWYKWLYLHKDDLISKTLNLSVEQTYIRQVSEEGVMEGSDRYQSMYILLPRIISAQDNLLWDKAIAKIEHLYQLRELQSLRYSCFYFGDLINFAACFDVSFSMNNSTVIEKLSAWLERDGNKCRLDLARILGKYEAEELFSQILAPYKDDYLGRLLYIHYVNGVIDAKRYDLAYQLIRDNQLSDLLYIDSIVTSIIVSQDNQLNLLANITEKDINEKAILLLRGDIFDLDKYIDVNLLNDQLRFIYLVMTDQDAMEFGNDSELCSLEYFDLTKFVRYIPYLSTECIDSLSENGFLSDCKIDLKLIDRVLFNPKMILINTIQKGYYNSFVKLLNYVTNKMNVSSKNRFIKDLLKYLKNCKDIRLDILRYLQNLQGKTLKYTSTTIESSFEAYLIFN